MKNLKITLLFSLIFLQIYAQGEGPKAFWPAPKGTSVVTPLYLNLKSNRIFTNPIFVEGAEFNTNVYGVMATTIFNIKGKTAAVAGVFSGGSTSGGLKDIYEGSSSGFADVYIMGILNLYGAPSATLEEYMKTKYNWIVDVQVAFKAPTGKYDKDKLVNLGTNRWQFKLGFPIMKFFNWGTAKVTSIEVLPSISFFTNNNELSNENETLQQKPIFNFESHVTQKLTKMLWVSFDSRKNRNINTNFIFHSDRGVQYASNKMTNLFYFNRKITQSMSRKGNCWDNAVAESFFKTIKYEWLYRFRFSSYLQLYESIDQYINWYNNERLHSSLGYITPLEMEIKLKGVVKKAA